jgi:hypothetical protein
MIRLLIDLDPDGRLWLYQNPSQPVQVELAQAGGRMLDPQVVHSGVKTAVAQILPDTTVLTMHVPKAL